MTAYPQSRKRAGRPAAAGRSRVVPAASSLDLVRRLPIDARYMRAVIEHLAALGSSPLGFRVTGTVEDRLAGEFVAGQMRASGLADVAVEPVTVDGWSFERASLEVAGRATIQGASFGGVPGTPAGGVRGRLVDVGAGERLALDGRELSGAIVLLDWRSARIEPAVLGLELGLRGAAAVVVSCPEGGPFYQSRDALGAFNSAWHAQAPPMITVAREDVAALREVVRREPLQARLRLRARLACDAAGANVVGYVDGDRPGPIVVGAHHDGWFSGAFDNASGVAAMLAVARALRAIDHRPRHRICFTSRTAEEYGLRDSAFDWCIGAFAQVRETHPEWGEAAPFHLCVEASGHPTLPILLEAPLELRAWLRATARAAQREGWIGDRWSVGPANGYTEAWPLLLAGIPSVTAYSWSAAFARTDYHTPADTPAIVDDHALVRSARLYALLLIEADRDPDAILDHDARARELERIGVAAGPAGRRLAGAARRRRSASGRGAFTAVGRSLLALDAGGHPVYPHEQAMRDVRHLDVALAALAGGERQVAARALARVGDNHLLRYVSQRAQAIEAERRADPGRRGSWGALSHLTPSPPLGRELAALRGEPGADPVGPQLRASLTAHRNASRRLARRRLSEMAGALEG